MKFVEKFELECRGPVDPEPPVEVNGTLLVGEEAIATWDEGQSSYGCDIVRVYPAYHNGKRAWIVSRTWDAAPGYSASGTEEEILPFEDGVKLLLEHGVYEHLFARQPA